MEQALHFAGLAVEPHEVLALATLAAISFGLPIAAVVLAVNLLAGAFVPWTSMLVLAPLLAAHAILGHPATRAKRLRLAALGETPEAVSYLAMSLRVRPSLDRAIAFAGDHTEGPFAVHLRRVLWDVHLRTRTRIEDAFLRLADEWGEWNEELKRALYAIAHAVREGSRDGLPRALDRARDLVFEGTRRRWQDYAAGLKGPTTALFALGVLLPLIIGSMLPLLSLSSFSPTSLEIPDPPPGDPLPWIVLLDVVFPAATFAFAHHVASRRPGLAVGARPLAWNARVGLALAPAPAAVIAGLVLPSSVSPLLVLGGVVAGVSLALFTATNKAQGERKRTDALEEAFPDALFQLGSRLGEGRGLEDAFFAVADGLGRTPAGDLFARIARSLRLGGGTVEAALFGPRGALRDVRCRTVRASLRMAVDLATKDPQTAGRALLEMSAHLRDLRGVERDLRAELRPTVDAMRATATFFAPVVLGVTGALYGLLARAFASVASLPMPPATFHAALGVYLLLATGAIQHFATRIDTGGDPGAFGAALARALPVAYGVFAVTLSAAGLVL